MVQYWRAAGMTYLRYSNKCSELLRQALKEPARAATAGKASTYEVIRSEWEAGKIVARETLSSKA